MTASEPVVLFERATARAVTVMAGVTTEQLDGPTPCADWDVQQLIDHMVGGTDYLLAALAGEAPSETAGRSVADYSRDSNSCPAAFVPLAAWTGCACRRSASTGRARRRWRGRSWMR